MRFVVLFDACVLYPAPLRDLALTGLFATRWTERIHDEWISNLLEQRAGLSREKRERTRPLRIANLQKGCCLIR